MMTSVRLSGASFADRITGSGKCTQSTAARAARSIGQVAWGAQTHGTCSSLL
jgi:hypothetical protein